MIDHILLQWLLRKHAAIYSNDHHTIRSLPISEAEYMGAGMVCMRGVKI